MNREHGDVYEPPTVVSLGDFNDLTRGDYGIYSDYFGTTGPDCWDGSCGAG